MFGMVRGWIIKDEGVVIFLSHIGGIIKKIIKEVHSNGLILTIAWMIWAADVYYFFEKNTV